MKTSHSLLRIPALLAACLLTLLPALPDSLAQAQVEVSVAVPDGLAAEAGPDPAVFRIARTGSTTASLTVSFRLDGTAVNGVDYLTLGPTVTIPAGAASVDLVVAPLDDGRFEPAETATLVLLPQAAYLVGFPDNGTVTISDNDVRPIVTVDATIPYAAELTGAPAEFTFTRTGSLLDPLVVPFDVTGTAIQGTDYEPIGNSIIIPAGSATAVLQVRPIQDLVVEPIETVVLTLLSPPDLAVGVPGVATISIGGTVGLPAISILALDAAASEAGPDRGVLRVQRTGPVDTALLVTLDWRGTATPGSDYTGAGPAVLIPAGSAVVDIVIDPVDDSLFEGPETVLARVGASTVYDIALRDATVTIADNDILPTVGVVATDATAAETTGVPDPAQFTLTRTGDLTQPLTVSLLLGGTAGNGVDYALLSPSVVIPAGSATATLDVVVVDDALFEGTETVSVTVLAPAGGTYAVALAASATASLVDNEVTPVNPNVPVVTVVATRPLTREVFPGQANVSGLFTLTRSGPMDGPLSVTFLLAGSALNGVDYLPVSTNVIFAPGTATLTVDILPVDDAVLEGTETVVLGLQPGADYLVGTPGVAMVSVEDNDPMVSVQAIIPVATERDQRAGLLVFKRTGSDLASLTVLYTVGGTAGPEDYLALPRSIVIPAGQESVQFSITPVDDAVLEAPETVVVTLSPLAGFGLGQTSASVTILDNDGPTNALPIITLVGTDTAYSEPGVEDSTFVVARTGSIVDALEVTLNVGGTATQVEDTYTPGTRIIIPAGLAYTTVSLFAEDDSLFETNETVTVAVAPQPGTYVLGPTNATVLVLADDDAGPATVTVTALDARASEPGTNSARFLITRDGSAAFDLPVPFVLGGTAIPGVDYAAVASPAVIPTGSKFVVVTITPLDDAVIEAPESVTLTLATNSTFVRGASASATVIIMDNDVTPLTVTPLVRVRFDEGSGTNAVNSGSAGGTLNLAAGRPLYTNAAAPGVGAPFAVDFGAATGNFVAETPGVLPALRGLSQFTIAGWINCRSATVGSGGNRLVHWINNTADGVELVMQSDGSLQLGVDQEASTTTARSSAGRISIDPAAGPANWRFFAVTYNSALSTGQVSFYFGNETANAALDVTRTYSGRGPVNTNISRLAIGHYNTSRRSGRTDRMFRGLMDDVAIFGAALGSTDLANLQRSLAQGTVEIVATAPATATEPGGSPAASFVVSRTGSTTQPLTVSLASVGSALMNADFSLPGLAVTIPAGQTSVTVPLTVLDDPLFEGTELATLMVEPQPEYLVGPAASASISIADNDLPPAPVVSLIPGVRAGSEQFPDGIHPIPAASAIVWRTGPVDTDLVVNYSTGGTAENGVDYETLSGTVTIPAGSASAVIGVIPIDDNEKEVVEKVIVALAAGPGYVVGGLTSAVLDIVDNDPVVTFATVTPAAEPSTEGSFVITRSGPPVGDLTVLLSPATGSARSGVDYQTLGTAVIIRDGASSVTLPVTVAGFDDALPEGTETVQLSIIPSPHYTVGFAGATLQIQDDDQPDAASPTVTLVSAVASTPSIAEQAASGINFTIPGRVTVYRTGPTNTDLVVRYAVSGTAMNVLDVVALPGSLLIPAGASSAEIEIFPIDDDVLEVNETVIITLLAGADYGLGSQPSATVTLVDNEPTVNVEAVASGLMENGAVPGQFRVWRTGPTQLPLTVLFQRAGTALAGADYLDFPLFTTIPAGQSELLIPVTFLDDLLPEGSETVTLTIDPSLTYTIGLAAADLVVFDNEVPAPAPALVSVEATADTAEGSATPGLFTFRRTGPASLGLTVPILIRGSARANADYAEVLQAVQFAPGASTATLAIQPKEDLVVEGDETVDISLVDGVFYHPDLTANTASIRILDNEPVVSVAATQPQANEEGPVAGTFTFTRAGSTLETISVAYTLGGTAQAGADYLTVSGSVLIPAGQTQATLDLTPVDDAAFEPTETVTLTLAIGPGYSVGMPNSATVSILDNEPSVTVQATDAIASEEGLQTGQFTLTRSGPAKTAMDVFFRMTGTATEGIDYASVGTVVTLPAGMNSTNIVIQPIQDPSAEPDETIVMTVQPGAGYAVGAESTATVTLLDNETVVTVVATDASAAEAGTNTGTFTLTRQGPLASPLIVSIALGGTAGPGSDYLSLPTTVTFARGAATATVTVVPIDDLLPEPSQNVVLTLLPNPLYLIGASSSATVIIADNDVSAPLMQYAFNEASGTVALDGGLAKQNANLLNGPVRTNGVVGRALRLDGSNDRVQATNSTAGNVSGAFTVAAWIRPERVDINQIVLMKGNSGNNAFSYCIRATSARPQYRWVSPAGVRTSYATTTNTLVAGRWTHVAVVHNPGLDPVLYIDAVPVPATRSEGAAANAVNTSPNPLAIGASADAASPFIGAIDEVFITPGALTAADIRSLTNGVPPGAPQVLPPLAIASSGTLPSGSAGAVYNHALAASGGTPPFTWSVVSGTLPFGLTLSTNTGILSGIPAAGGSSTFRLAVRDAAQGVAEQDFNLGITTGLNLPAHLVSWWRLDEAGGTTALDAANLNPGTLENGVTRTTGHFGGAASFAAPGDRILIPDSPTLDFTTNFTVSLWFKPAALLDGTSGTQTLLKKTGAYWIAFNYAANDGKVVFSLNTDSPRIKAAAPLSWAADSWNHVVGTHDGQALRIYVNGALAGTRPLTTTPAANSASPLQIGSDDAGFLPFNGAIDDVRLYSMVLGDSDVAALYNASTADPLPRRLIPAPVVLVSGDAAQTTISWVAEPGRTYRIEFKDSLEDAEWSPLPDEVFGYDSDARYVDLHGPGTQRFYRVVLLP